MFMATTYNYYQELRGLLKKKLARTVLHRVHSNRRMGGTQYTHECVTKDDGYTVETNYSGSKHPFIVRPGMYTGPSKQR
jgi:hypothetical protein